MQPIDKAKQLRQRSTEAEKTLWHQLRNRRLGGFKFRRQVPVGEYIVDFVCVSEMLIIELDGEYHDSADQVAYDVVRTQFLEAAGYRVLRFGNWQVLGELDFVLKEILSGCTFTPNPSP